MDLGHRDSLGHADRLLVPARYSRRDDSKRRRAGFDRRDFRRDVSHELQLDQFVADGPDDRDRLRGRRCDRGARKYIPPRRCGKGARRGGADRRAGSWIYRAVNQHLVDRGVHSDSSDGRDSRPSVSRIRAHSFACHPRLARLILDLDADDVRAVSSAAPWRDRETPVRSIRQGPAGLRANARLGTAPRHLGYGGFAFDCWPQRRIVQDRAKGLLSAAGHWPFGGLHSGRPGDCQCQGLYRLGLGDQFRLGLYRPEAKGPRSETADEVIDRLRRKLTQVPGARLYLQSVQDIRMGGRASNAQYQFTLQGESTSELYAFVPRLVDALQNSSGLADVNSDQQQTGLETDIVIDRETAFRLRLIVTPIDNTLYDAFGQRQVSTIYSAVNQYHVVMEVDPRYWQDSAILKDLFVRTSRASPSGTAMSIAVAGTVTQMPSPASPGSSGVTLQSTAKQQSIAARNAQTNALATTGKFGASAGAAVSTAKETSVPFSAFSHFGRGHTPLAVNHQGLFVASTLSSNFKPGASLIDA